MVERLRAPRVICGASVVFIRRNHAKDQFNREEQVRSSAFRRRFVASRGRD